MSSQLTLPSLASEDQAHEIDAAVGEINRVRTEYLEMLRTGTLLSQTARALSQEVELSPLMRAGISAALAVFESISGASATRPDGAILPTDGVIEPSQHSTATSGA